MPNRHSAPRSPMQWLWSPLDCRSCRSLASSALPSAASPARSFTPRFWRTPSTEQTHVHVVRHIRTPVLAWMVAAGVAWGCAQGPGPLVIRAALSSCVAVGLYFGLLFLTRRELTLGWRGSTGLGFAAASCAVEPVPASLADGSMIAGRREHYRPSRDALIQRRLIAK